MKKRRRKALPFNSFLLFCLAQRESKKKRELMGLPRGWNRLVGRLFVFHSLHSFVLSFLQSQMNCRKDKLRYFSSSLLNWMKGCLFVDVRFFRRSHWRRAAHNPPKEPINQTTHIHSTLRGKQSKEIQSIFNWFHFFCLPWCRNARQQPLFFILLIRKRRMERKVGLLNGLRQLYWPLLLAAQPPHQSIFIKSNWLLLKVSPR